MSLFSVVYSPESETSSGARVSLSRIAPAIPPVNPQRKRTIHALLLDVTLTIVTDIQELLERLDWQRGSFSADLVAEVIARRGEGIRRNLEILEDVGRNPEPWLVDGGRMVHIYAMYLLALFRETRAYLLLVRIFSRPGEFSFDLAGDVVTEDLGRILASVSGGYVSGLTALIENGQDTHTAKMKIKPTASK